MMFDLLVDDGRDIMQLPLIERKARLTKLFKGIRKSRVLVVGDLPAQAELFDQFVLPLKLEGFMAKRLLAPYQQGPDRSPDWVKVKRKGAILPGRFKR